MKNRLLFGFCIALLTACNTSKTSNLPVSLTWEMGANGIEPGYYENTFYLVNTGETALDGNWVIYFNQISAGATRNTEEAPLAVERIQSTYFKMYPTSSYQSLAAGDTLKFTFRCRGGIIKESAAPQGAYIVLLDENGEEKSIHNIPVGVVPFTQACQWTRRGALELPYPDGNYMYEQNAFFSESVTLDETSIFPSIKRVEKTGGDFIFSKNIQLKYDSLYTNEALILKEKLISLFGCSVSDRGETLIELKHSEAEWKYIPEYYEISIKDNKIEINGIDNHGFFDGCMTLLNIIGNLGDLPAKISNMQIADSPDTQHRGIMLDIARNFTKKENILKLIDWLALYKLNVLHWHLTDDEAWRLEIPGLEELTGMASRRGHDLDESTCLYPAFFWGWDASDTTTLANGYYTRNDFIEVLKYANQRHIKVIPEVDMPGHSRAAIKAMNVRYNKYLATDKAKAEEYLLIDFADTSKYNSAQNFTDNVINVALPSSYRFVEKVIDEIDKMYTEAGLKLEVFHIGGDEVPKGAWEGSPICRDFMQANGMKEIRDLKDYFLEKVLPMLSKRNIQPAGWEEVAMHGGTPNPKFTDSNILSYCWNTLPAWKGDELPYKLANAGYPVILCNVTNLYMDMSYNRHQSEPGLHWGGFVNEYNSFDMLPYDIYKSVRSDLNGLPFDINAVSKGKAPLNKEAKIQIKGLQGQLWAETIRSFEQVQYDFFPKLYGLIERAWNIQPEWSSPYNEQKYESAKREYNAKIARRELPRLSKMNVNFRVSQPGIIVKDHLLYANSAIRDAVIRYTTDGSYPTENSAVWTEPVACDAKLVQAKAFYLGKQSVTTLLVTGEN
ncbi:MAG: carbohydate-binding domain-containing protein [Dysgonamonadaceae bacterium]|jgi:hexosaminidase|nr:carbohydate-binding domain-containing protein [Dysgonamonadaceae bacterium]